MAYFVGIDIGGTFTDAVLLDDSGTARLLKTPTTPQDPAVGVNKALALAEEELGLGEAQVLSEVEYFGLGTTVATNALIERKGVKTGIITTRGFRDIILMQRGMALWTGRELHEIMHFSRGRPPEPVVERPLIREVTERVDYKGEVVTPLLAPGRAAGARQEAGEHPRGARHQRRVLWGIRRHEARFRAARSFLREVWTDNERTLADGRKLDQEQQTLSHLAASHLSRTTLEISQLVHRFAGPSVIRDGPLQRFFRDVHAGMQHRGSSAVVTQQCGRMLSGVLPEGSRWGAFDLVVPRTERSGV